MRVLCVPLKDAKNTRIPQVQSILKSGRIFTENNTKNVEEFVIIHISWRKSGTYEMNIYAMASSGRNSKWGSVRQR